MSSIRISPFQNFSAIMAYPKNIPGKSVLPNWWSRDGGIWSFPTWTRNRLPLHRHPEMSHDVVEETLLILQESQRDFLLELIDAVPRWMFSDPDLLQGFWFVHLRLEKWILLVWEISPLSHWVFSSRFARCVHRLQLLKVCDQYVTLPNSPRVQRVSEEQSK